jgi:Ca2+-transporting ATPase
MFNAFNWRSDRYSIFSLGFFTNRALIYAVLITVVLQLMVIYIPFFQKAFRTVPLSLFEWGVILALASTTLISMEFVKYISRKKLQKNKL